MQKSFDSLAFGDRNADKMTPNMGGMLVIESGQAIDVYGSN